MRYDTIIIGGGLSGLLSGIALARKGQSVAIVSAGQSALHFCSGSFELFGKSENPFEGIARLPESHPYKRIGVGRVKKYAGQVVEIFSFAGVKCSGSVERNHYRLTPIGMMKPAWLTLDDYACFENCNRMAWRKVAFVDFEGYLDFYPHFLESAFAQRGVACDVIRISLDELERLRESSTEMRASTIARIIGSEGLEKIARAIEEQRGEAEALFMPATFGLFDSGAVDELRAKVGVPLYFVPTMPTSVPGVRTQIQLRRAFQRLGGEYMLGDSVTGGRFECGRLRSVFTENHGDMELLADNFILASGSFFSHGLIAEQDVIREPVFDLDVKSDARRSDWYDKDLYAHQPYMGYGVVTDEKLRCQRAGRTIENLYAAGSVLANQNAIEQGTGGGVAITTALFVADEILNI